MTPALERSTEESTKPSGLALPRRIGRGTNKPPPSSEDSPNVTSRVVTPTIIRRRGGKKTEEIKYGPKQIPIEEQAGIHLDRSVMDEFAKDSLGRDVFTIEERIQEWEETEELYLLNRDAPTPIDSKILRISEYGIHLNGGDMGEGKSWRKGTPMLMYDGNIQNVEDIVEGDLLMGPDSMPRTVLKTTKGHGPMFRIVPTKGDPWECNDVHILTLVRVNGALGRGGGDKPGDIIDVPLDEWLTWTSSKKILYKLFRVSVDFPWQPPVPVEPYFLGLLLGDGSMTHNIMSVAVAVIDPEIEDYCQDVAERWGCNIRKSRYTHTDAAFGHNFNVGTGKDSKTIRNALKEIGVWGHTAYNKFVPHQYLTAPREDRLEILAGLMDSDGNLVHNYFDFVSASIQLADDVAYLARSVGLAAYMKPKYIQYNGEEKVYWRVKISGHTDMVPTKLPRKQATPRQQKKDVLRTAFEVESIGDDDYYGFVLDGDGRCLLGDFTVTHNTLAATWIARHFRRRGWNVFSTAGLLFGQRLRLAEAYAFPDHVTPGGFIFADEVHTLVDRYSSNSVRSRTFGQSSTAMRKERVTCIGASAHTIMVGWEYKGVSESVMVPRRWYPSGKLHAPPFCHIEIVRLFPFPYRRKDQLLMDAGLVRGIDQKRGSWRPAPQELMAAAKLMDSFESVKIGENFGIGSKEMKEEREGRGGATAEGQSGGQPNLVWVIRRVWEAGYIKEGAKVFFTTLRDIIGQAGLDISATKIRSALEMAGCDVSGTAVHEEDLRTLFEGLDSERAV